MTKPKFPWIAFTVLMILIAACFMLIPEAKSCSTPQVREYEDHSARIIYQDYMCIIPAFDSPGDKIQCHKR